ncbi:MAG: terpene cyclase/mutase family protein [Akkermansiaceae bacterium]|nr:terpene cyclase/mutase family protein [Akkermansiaceae bacterium]
MSMRAIVATAALFLLSAGTVPAEDGFQQWKNRKGQIMTARFIELQGDSVIFEMENGQRVPYPAADLDLDSQSRVREMEKAAKLARLPAILRTRCGAPARQAALAAGGAPAEIEGAVVKGLNWLKTRQDKNAGSLGEEFPVGMTGFALLAWLGHCETPESPEFGDNVANGALYLMEMAQKKDGVMWNGENGTHKCYEHGIATYALAELQLMTKDSGRSIPQLDAVLTRAVKIILDGQTGMGGWAYGYADNDDSSDMSLTGWQMQALRAAYLDGIETEKIARAMEKGLRYLEKIQDDKGAFKYRPKDPAGKSTLTGAAVYNLLKWGAKDTPAHQKGIAYLADIYRNPAPGNNLYAPYYNTLAFFADGDAGWETYSRAFIPKLLAAQNADGSFLSATSGFPGKDTPIMNTTLALLCLETYYRYPREADNGR